MWKRICSGEDWLSRQLAPSGGLPAVALVCLVGTMCSLSPGAKWPPGAPIEFLPDLFVGIVILFLALFSFRRDRRWPLAGLGWIALGLAWLKLSWTSYWFIKSQLDYPWIVLIPAFAGTLLFTIMRGQRMMAVAVIIFMGVWFAPSFLPAGSPRQTARRGNLELSYDAGKLTLRTLDGSSLRNHVVLDWVNPSSNIGPLIHPKEPWVHSRIEADGRESSIPLSFRSFAPRWAKWETLEVSIGLKPKTPDFTARVPLKGGAITVTGPASVELTVGGASSDPINLMIGLSGLPQGTGASHFEVEIDSGSPLASRYGGSDFLEVEGVPPNCKAVTVRGYLRSFDFDKHESARFVFERLPKWSPLK